VVPPGQSRQIADLAVSLVQVTAVAGADHNHPALFGGPEVVAAVVAVAEEVDPIRG
jgi:hypothetical protein